jgi:hypothetical protein
MEVLVMVWFLYGVGVNGNVNVLDGTDDVIFSAMISTSLLSVYGFSGYMEWQDVCSSLYIV